MVRIPLDRAATLAFVRERMGCDSPAGSTHAETVAANASELSRRYYLYTRGPGYSTPNRELPEILEHAGLLHELIAHHGCNYDDIVDISNSDVADAVVALTPDIRLPEPKRILEFRGILSALTPGLTALFMCDIADHVERVFAAEVLAEADEHTLPGLILKADQWYADLQVLRYARGGLLGEYYNSITTVLTGARDQAGRALSDARYRNVVAQNIRKRQSRKEPDNGEVQPARGSAKLDGVSRQPVRRKNRRAASSE